MDLAGIYHKANILIAQTYGITGVPEKRICYRYC